MEPRTSDCLPPLFFLASRSPEIMISTEEEKKFPLSFFFALPPSQALSPCSIAPRRVQLSFYYAAPLRAQHRRTILDASLRGAKLREGEGGDDDGEEKLPAAAIGDDDDRRCRCLVFFRLLVSLLAAIEARPVQAPPGVC